MRAKRLRRLARRRADRRLARVFTDNPQDSEFLTMSKNVERMRECVNAPLRAEHLTFACPLCKQIGDHADGCRLRGFQ